jgi:CRISPR-associated Csx2 family protein
MNGYTLISSLGTGMSRNGYEPVTYQFPNEKEYTTSLFLEAILKTGSWPIKKVILIGTRTTSWDALIPNRDSNENVNFWQKILEECENKETGISNESVAELEAMLPIWYDDAKFKIMPPHADKISFGEVEDVFSVYMNLPDELEPGTDILFDITHGFRSMPLLIFQSLQINTSKIQGRNVKLIYGELDGLVDGKKISCVRDLSKYWEYYEVTAAKKLFEEKFDGKLLADKLSPYWENGAKWLVRFGKIVECNFSLQMPDALKQLKNTLKDYDGKQKPQWVSDVRNDLDAVYKKLTGNAQKNYPVAGIVWEFSKLLQEKELITQAVIALQVVVETAVAERYDPSQIGNYNWFNGYTEYVEGRLQRNSGVGHDYLEKIRKQNNTMNINLFKIEWLRNQIAHGGGKDKKGNYPHGANVPSILKLGNAAVLKLFELLER